MFKTILVPIDLGHMERGKPMLEVARKMSDKDARIILINVVAEIPGYVAAELPTDWKSKAGDRAQEDLEALARAAGLKPDVEVRSGSPHDAILAYAEECGADLIVIGSHKPGLQDYLIGSTASRVVRHAQCPVLVMR